MADRPRRHDRDRSFCRSRGPELDEQLRGIAERMQAGYLTPATDATHRGIDHPGADDAARD
jgi:hypothetical protein